MLLCLVVAGASLIEGAVADSGSFLLVSGVSGPEEMCVANPGLLPCVEAMAEGDVFKLLPDGC